MLNTSLENPVDIVDLEQDQNNNQSDFYDEVTEIKTYSIDIPILTKDKKISSSVFLKNHMLIEIQATAIIGNSIVNKISCSKSMIDKFYYRVDFGNYETQDNLFLVIQNFHQIFKQHILKKLCIYASINYFYTNCLYRSIYDETIIRNLQKKDNSLQLSLSMRGRIIDEESIEYYKPEFFLSLKTDNGQEQTIKKKYGLVSDNNEVKMRNFSSSLSTILVTNEFDFQCKFIPVMKYKNKFYPILNSNLFVLTKIKNEKK